MNSGGSGQATPAIASITPSRVNATLTLHVLLEGSMGRYPANLAPMDPAVFSQFPARDAFASAPFSYSGSEELSPEATGLLQDGRLIDWVLVRIRQETSPYSIIASRAGLLRTDGLVVDPDGSSPLSFPDLPIGNYRISVAQVSHLAVLSSFTLPVDSSGNYEADLTNPSHLEGSSGSSFQVMNGKACMAGGDVNQDGRIDANDRTLMNADTSAFLFGYQSTDVNRDGSTDAFDLPYEENNEGMKASWIPGI